MSVQIDREIAEILNVKLSTIPERARLMMTPMGIIYSPSTKPEHGNPIIEKYGIKVEPQLDGIFKATMNGVVQNGNTPLLAAMCCFVAAHRPNALLNPNSPSKRDPIKKTSLDEIAKTIASSLITQNEANRLSKLSPEDRKKVLEVTANIIAAKLWKKSAAPTKNDD